MAKRSATDSSTTDFKKEIQKYSDFLSKYGATIWENFVLLSLLNDEVQEHFVHHVRNNELYLEARCWSGPGIPGKALVLFHFKCLPPSYSIITSAFLVELDVEKQKVINITDPYDGYLIRSNIESCLSAMPFYNVPFSDMAK